MGRAVSQSTSTPLELIKKEDAMGGEPNTSLTFTGSYVVVDSHRLIALCNKVLQKIQQAQEEEKERILENDFQKQLQRGFLARLFYGKPLTKEELRASYEQAPMRGSMYSFHPWYFVDRIGYWACSVAKRLASTARFSDRVFVFADDMHRLYGWVSDEEAEQIFGQEWYR